MYQDRNASTSGDNRISGGAEVTIDGAFYFPRQEIVITGNATIQGDEECASFVGRLVSVGGSSQVQIECDTSSDFAILLSTGSKIALLRE